MGARNGQVWRSARASLGALLLLPMLAVTFSVATAAPAGAATKTHTFWNENFDGVPAPALPADWSAQCVSCQAGDPAWVSVNFGGQVADNRAFARALNHVTDNQLVSR